MSFSGRNRVQFLITYKSLAIIIVYNMQNSNLLKALAALISIAFAIHSIKVLWVGLSYRFRGKLTTGYVVDVEKFEDSNVDGGTIIRHRIKVRFLTESGLEITNVVEKNEDYYHTGLPVYILYDTKKPLNFLVNSPKADEEILWGIIFLIISIGSSLMAIFIKESDS